MSYQYAVAESGPIIHLHEEPLRVQVEPGGETVTIVYGFDGETNAHWRNLFVEAFYRQFELHPAKAAVTEEGIVLSGLPRARQHQVRELVADAVREANRPFTADG